MRFRDLDLNLLLVLDVLLTEQSVTRAAAQLNLTQPAISNALKRLRQHFGDELLIQFGNRLALTPFAETIALPLRDTLAQMKSLTEARHGFDPKTAVATFTICTGDWIVTSYVSALVRRISREAPGIRIAVTTLTDRGLTRFRAGEIDLLIIQRERLASGHPSAELFKMRFACIAWSKNKLVRRPFSEANYLALGHVITLLGDAEHIYRYPDGYLDGKGYDRKVAALTPSYALTADFVVETPYVATIPEPVAHIYAKRLQLQVLPLPIEVPTVDCRAQWHESRRQDPLHAWVREQLFDLCRQVPAAAE